MAGMLFGFPFDEEIFNHRWQNEPDPITTALHDSGAVQLNAEIAAQISQGSDFYTVPFYKTIGGEPQNYDGKTDIVAVETKGGFQSGIVFGRMQAWTARDFTGDFNKADPMGSIASQVSKFWAKYRQTQIVGILNGVFGITATGDYASWANHITDISASGSTVAASNKLSETTIGDATVKACGDNAADSFNLAIMHSVVANNLAGKDLLEYRKYTDPMGIQRQLRIADIDGFTVVVSDQVPVTGDKYTTYVLGNGAIQYAPASVKHPVEGARDPYKNGGQETLITRKRETLLPNGFTWTKKTDDNASVADSELFSSSRYTPIYDPKCIAMAKIVSNG